MRKLKLLSAPKGNIFTQGVIFNNAVASGFDDHIVYGLIITARCDIAQNKISSVHYCPIVTVKDWIDVYGWNEIKNRVISDSFVNMGRCLTKCGKSKDILSIEKPKDVYEKHFVGDDTVEKKIKKAFKSYLDRYTNACSAINQADVLSTFDGELHTYIKEIVNNKITGLSFIEDVELQGNNEGYVILLREINKISLALAENIKVGLSNEEYKKYCEAQPAHSGCLNFSHDYLCFACSMINSPFIELIMQQFSLLFSRIGVEDVDPMHIDKICNLCTKGNDK